jgi:hypothetical protein
MQGQASQRSDVIKVQGGKKNGRFFLKKLKCIFSDPVRRNKTRDEKKRKERERQDKPNEE